METKVAEIAPKIYRLSTFVPDIAPPAGFTMNQFLVDSDEPLLFHTGPRAMFPSVYAAVGKIMPIERLRWISFSHLEADESGAMNLWLAAAPKAQVTHGALACMVSLNDLADRPPRTLNDGEVMDIGGKKLRHIDTPHVPHGWDAGLFFDETTSTLLCSDLFTHAGNPKPVTSESILEPAIATENAFLSTALTPLTAPTIRKLAALKPKTLAVMHGSSFEGDCAGALNALADFYAERLAEAL
ncbi:MAG: MBL fold metallo-hydrolase [Alphaproteobacteria bacterium]